MNNYLFILFFGLLLVAAGPLAAQTAPYEPAHFIQGSDTLPYRILYPKNFDPSTPYPLILVLHGGGERGNDNQKQLVHGGALFQQEAVRSAHPAVVVFPQCPADSYWSNVQIDRSKQPLQLEFSTSLSDTTRGMALLQGLVQKLAGLPYIDSLRMYVGGLSMGGMGTLELLRREPNRFAAAFAICGGDAPANAAAYARVPVWIFHGEQDSVVPVAHSLAIAEALEAAGANIRLTLYPQVDHNSWEQAFREPDLLPWLFSKKKEVRHHPKNIK
ncbi:carboxylesterase family protein [Cesiribacter andamanensis]|uniref:Esterase n=1 Tax=Cesiribacter andamanensis AMV16 TaxID=1279009 RepID=M7NU42_9BACT|nr:prolyl oligopeptidase family serine peptidase [Cesiribacter andamanensis]EMR02014.1 esterase [Cesiribacter andamanensis AMV16]